MEVLENIHQVVHRHALLENKNKQVVSDEMQLRIPGNAVQGKIHPFIFHLKPKQSSKVLLEPEIVTKQYFSVYSIITFNIFSHWVQTG